MYRFFIVYALLLAAIAFVYQHKSVFVPSNVPLDEMPAQIGNWRMVGESRFDNRVLAVLKPSDYVSRTYRNDKGRDLALYIGYHGGGPDSGPIHSPKHCLPGSGWQELETREGQIKIGKIDLPVNIALYQNGMQKEIFVYWYQVKGTPLTSEYALKFAEVWNSMAYNRKDSAFIRLSMSLDGEKDTCLSLIENFIENIYPTLNRFLPQ